MTTCLWIDTSTHATSCSRNNSTGDLEQFNVHCFSAQRVDTNDKYIFTTHYGFQSLDESSDPGNIGNALREVANIVMCSSFRGNV